MSDLDVELSGERYVLRREGGDLRVGRRVGEDVTWLESVGVETLPEQARAALESGDAKDESLTIALRGVVQAEVERGG
jgi:hypothetical protein